MEGYKYDDAKINERAGKPIIAEEANNGITIRSIREVFRQAQEMQSVDKTVTISVSFLQIYNEKVFDLLNTGQLKKSHPSQSQGLKIRWSKNDQFQVENLLIFKCESPDQALELYNKGIKNKVVASHNLNQASSRSHAIFTIQIDIQDLSQASVDNVVQSKLQLVDLAGSERSLLTGATGLAQKESIDINKSLFTLRKVITGLAESSKSKKAASALQHIPYRDSKLTCLLKQSLGGNSYCLMIACLSPSDAYVEENLSTLAYATKASYISNEPVKNEDPKVKLINDLKNKVQQLQKELAQANNHIQFLSNLTGQPVPSTNITNQSSTQSSTQVCQMEESKESSKEIFEQQKKPQVRTEIVQKTVVVQQQSSQQSDYFNKLDHQSVDMVKELMSSNRTLRETLDTLTSQHDRSLQETFQLQMENRDLRDRIEILESVMASSTTKSDFDQVNTIWQLRMQLDWRDLIMEAESSKTVKTVNTGNIALNEMAKELIEQKRANRSLQEEVDALRQEIEEIKFFQNKNAQLQYQAQVQQQQMYQVPKQREENNLQKIYNAYSGETQQQQAKRSQSNGFSAQKSLPPQTKQEALKMLNDMMNKRVQQKKR